MIQRLLVALATTLAAFGAVPSAHAVDAAALTCLEDTLGQSAVAAIQDDVAAKLTAGKSLNESFDTNSIREPVSTCITRYNLTPEIGSTFAKYSLARLMVPAMERAIRARGGDPAAMTAVYRELPESLRQRLGTGQVGMDEVLKIIVPKLNAHGIGAEKSNEAGALDAMLSIIEFSSRALAAA